MAYYKPDISHQTETLITNSITHGDGLGNHTHPPPQVMAYYKPDISHQKETLITNSITNGDGLGNQNKVNC